MTITVAQLRAGRALLDWTTTRLASASRVHRETIGRIESGRVFAPQKATLARLVAALEQGGVFFAENGMVGIKSDVLKFSESVSIKSGR
jgi:transcriptional regulator with XRE-family HTH domain